MKKKTNIWLMLVIALILGGATFFLTQTYLKNKEKELQGAYKPDVAKTTKVIVSIGGINKGDILKGGMVAPVEYPSEFVSDGAISPANASRYFGQISNIPIKRGQIIYASNLGGNAVDRFSDLLKDGGTAVTLEVDAKKSNSHMLVPGDFVDILVLTEKSKVEPTSLLDVTKAKQQADNKMLVPLLSKIKVLSVDRNPLVAKDEEYRIPVDQSGQIPTYSYITVGVPINDATKLALAQDLGSIVFFLRNALDPMHVKVKTLDGLFATYEDEDSNKPKNTYEYYSPNARAKLSFVSDKNKSVGVKNNSNIVINSPALTFDKKSYPRIQGQDVNKQVDEIEKTIKESIPSQ